MKYSIHLSSLIDYRRMETNKIINEEVKENCSEKKRAKENCPEEKCTNENLAKGVDTEEGCPEEKRSKLDEKMCLISVVIPVHNASKFLDETLTSVLNQTWRESLEVSVYDDASKLVCLFQRYKENKPY